VAIVSFPVSFIFGELANKIKMQSSTDLLFFLLSDWRPLLEALVNKELKWLCTVLNWLVKEMG
jgi:hypothetical protein